MKTGVRVPPSGFGREEAQALGGVAALLVITASWWALALWPTGGGGPAWLERTRYVCFGVTETGLPDLGGWIGLIGGPVGMLLILLIGWGSGFRGLLRRARTSRRLALGLSSLLLGFLVIAAGAAIRVQSAVASSAVTDSGDGLAPEKYVRIDRAAPPLSLLAHSGDRFELSSVAGRPALVTFAFGHCETICPLIVRDVLQARESLLGEEAEPSIVIVTVDPWRDTPSRLPGIADAWGLPEEGAWLLSGPVDEVEAVLDGWEMPRDRDVRTGNVYHPSLVYIVDAEGRLAFASGGRVETLVALLRRL